MADYISNYTGTQIDEAVRIAQSLGVTLTNYITYSDINKTVPGLTDGKLNISQLPIASTSTPGIVQIGEGLSLSNNIISVDSEKYYTRSIIDEKLISKVDQVVVDDLLTTLDKFNNYNINITQASEQDIMSAQTYYQLTIN